MEEVWKDIEGYEGIYQVSNLTRVRSVDRYVRTSRGGGLKPVKGKILKQAVLPNGYVGVRLQKDNKVKTHLVHRLVAQAFIPNPDNLPQVNHKSEVKTENSIENLEWCNADYNVHYGTGIKRNQEKQISKPVLCYSLDGNFIDRYHSIREASRITCANKANIKFCCENKPRYKSAGGFKWRYAS